MRFFDKLKLNRTIAPLTARRNMALGSQRGSVHSLFFLMPVYLDRFFRDVSSDPNTDDVLQAMLLTDITSLSKIYTTLVFWFFWSMDRLQGVRLLDDPTVRLGFSTIWEMDDEQFNLLVESFDKFLPGQQPLLVWKLICKDLHNTALSPIIGTVHIRNAQVGALKFMEQCRSMRLTP